MFRRTGMLVRFVCPRTNFCGTSMIIYAIPITHVVKFAASDCETVAYALKSSFWRRLLIALVRWVPFPSIVRCYFHSWQHVFALNLRHISHSSFDATLTKHLLYNFRECLNNFPPWSWCFLCAFHHVLIILFWRKEFCAGSFLTIPITVCSLAHIPQANFCA